MPNEARLGVYTALSSAGQTYGITDYGSFAKNVMRVEKRFKGAGELTNEVTLPEADVMRFVHSDKPNLGKAETLEKTDDLPWVCTYLAVGPDGDEDGHGVEAVLLDDKVVGSVASMAYGHTAGKILSFARTGPHAAIWGTALEVVIAGTPRPAMVLGEAAYDPRNPKPRPDGSAADPSLFTVWRRLKVERLDATFVQLDTDDCVTE